MRLILLFALCAVPLAHAQERLPIIDMHLHAWAADANGPPPLAMCTPMTRYAPSATSTEAWVEGFMAVATDPPCDDPLWSAATDEAVIEELVAAMEEHHVVGLLSGKPDRVLAWLEAAPGRFIPGIQLQIGRDDYSADSLRRFFEEGPFAVLGEVTNQYVGIAPDDERMEPYWALAEALDIPVGIHFGEGPTGAAALMPGFRVALSNPLLLEPVLARHPGLRVAVMHYGSPFIDETIALLGAYPQIYLDLGGIQWFYPRAYFYRQLQEIVDAGFGNRVMFGSDAMTWPGLIERSIAIIEEAPFLKDEQKRDIFYNNAARFLRLSEETIARHHGR